MLQSNPCIDCHRDLNILERRKVTPEHLFSHINSDGRFDYVLILYLHNKSNQFLQKVLI